MTRRLDPPRAERAAMVRLYRSHSYARVAEIVGWHLCVVRRVLREEGVAIRDRAEAARFGNARKRAAPR